MQKNNTYPVTSADRYIVACSIVTFIFTAVIVAGHFFTVTETIFVGTKVEGVVIIILVVFWSAIVSINTDAGGGSATFGTGSNTVQNANLYYFSWAGFVTSIVLLASFLRDAFGVDLAGNIRDRAARLQWWAALLASSVVVMGSAAHTNNKDCGANYSLGASYCRKTRFAISAGAIGLTFCILVIASKVIKYTATDAASPFVLEVGISVVLMVINAFAVAYTTSANAPGSAVGNLYYFSWAMFLISAYLVSDIYSDFVKPPQNTEEEHGTANGRQYDSNRGEIEVETFDDNI